MFISDMQVPSHDYPAISAVTEFIADFEPDKLFVVGDEYDAPGTGRWKKGLAGEFLDNLQEGLDETNKILGAFRTVLGEGKEFVIQRSNHTDRIKMYIDRYAPALSSLRRLDYSELLGLKDLDIRFSNEITDVAPGWCMAHGDESGLNRTSGGTALGLARRIGKSVICGHSHSLGLQHDNAAYNGKISRNLYGFEVGHLMDLKKADSAAGGYLKYGGANWQAGFGILYVHEDSAHPVPVPIINNSFVVEGQRYAW